MNTGIDYENPWCYNDGYFTSDDIGDYFGFVYNLPISTTNDNTLGESIFGLLENLKEKKEK